MSLKIKYIHNIFGNYWIVRNQKNEILGTLGFRRDWKRLRWNQHKDIDMASDCLRELADAMDKRLKFAIKENKEGELA